MGYRKRRVKYPSEIHYDDDGWVVEKAGELPDDPTDDIAFVQTETLADTLIAALKIDRRSGRPKPTVPVADVLRDLRIHMYGMEGRLDRILQHIYAGTDRLKFDRVLRVGDLRGLSYEDIYMVPGLGHTTIHPLVEAGLVPPRVGDPRWVGVSSEPLDYGPEHAMPYAVAVPGKKKLVCPHCGNGGLANFQWLEDYTSYRELISLKGGVLRMHSYYQIYDENGTQPRLLCKKCDQECLVPEGIDLDWE
jgi:hypothetical protein